VMPLLAAQGETFILPFFPRPVTTERQPARALVTFMRWS
jgi:hypothetical protein